MFSPQLARSSRACCAATCARVSDGEHGQSAASEELAYQFRAFVARGSRALEASIARDDRHPRRFARGLVNASD